VCFPPACTHPISLMQKARVQNPEVRKVLWFEV